MKKSSADHLQMLFMVHLVLGEQAFSKKRSIPTPHSASNKAAVCGGGCALLCIIIAVACADCPGFLASLQLCLEAPECIPELAFLHEPMNICLGLLPTAILPPVQKGTHVCGLALCIKACRLEHLEPHFAGNPSRFQCKDPQKRTPKSSTRWLIVGWRARPAKKWGHPTRPIPLHDKCSFDGVCGSSW